MKKSKFSEEQMVEVLKESAAGMRAPDVCRKFGISLFTFYKWKKKFSGMEVADVRKMRELEVENAKLKRIVANQAVDILVLKDVVSKKW